MCPSCGGRGCPECDSIPLINGNALMGMEEVCPFCNGLGCSQCMESVPLINGNALMGGNLTYSGRDFFTHKVQACIDNPYDPSCAPCPTGLWGFTDDGSGIPPDTNMCWSPFTWVWMPPPYGPFPGWIAADSGQNAIIIDEAVVNAQDNPLNAEQQLISAGWLKSGNFWFAPPIQCVDANGQPMPCPSPGGTQSNCQPGADGFYYDYYGNPCSPNTGQTLCPQAADGNYYDSLGNPCCDDGYGNPVPCNPNQQAIHQAPTGPLVHPGMFQHPILPPEAFHPAFPTPIPFAPPPPAARIPTPRPIVPPVQAPPHALPPSIATRPAFIPKRRPTISSQFAAPTTTTTIF